MTHVILGSCCKDGACARVCPQNCIHPLPGEDGFDSADSLYIDPESCIDCTACVEACPASAIKPARSLSPDHPYLAFNREFYAQVPPPPRGRLSATFQLPLGIPHDKLKVAIVGAGPAAMYTVRELLNRSTSIHVTVYELHDAVGGLLQRGVSLNNPGVRKMSRLFDLPFHDDRVTTILNTEVGRDISINELRTEYDAVILACGASQPRQVGRDLCGNGIYQALDILVGENDPASVSSPSALTGPVCIVVGAGNVAFDIVRWVAENRHQASKNSQVRELLVLSRSAPESAAFTRSAFYELLDLADADILIDSDGDLPGAESALLCELSQLPSTVFCGMHTLPTDTTGPLRIILSFGQEVAELAQEGSSAVAVTTIKGRIFHANSTICATGFTTKWINGVPLNEHGFVPNRSGQVVSPETGEPLIGLYVVGWAKRGASGGVGENRACAAETVAQLVADRHSRV